MDGWMDDEGLSPLGWLEGFAGKVFVPWFRCMLGERRGASTLDYNMGQAGGGSTVMLGNGAEEAQAEGAA